MSSSAKKSLGLVAHDEKKELLANWCIAHKDKLANFELFATGTTGQKIIDQTGLVVKRLESGPLGGDAQLGAMIAEKRLDGLIFFIDGLAAMPHDVDVKALVRLCAVYDIPLACNRMSGDMMITSPLFREPARLKARPQPEVRFSSYANRKVPDAE